MTEIERKRNYLEQIWEIKEQVKEKRIDLMQTREDKASIKAFTCSDMPTSHEQSDLSKRYIKYDEKEKRLEKEIYNLLEKKENIINKINDIDNTEYKIVLKEYYINKRNRYQIAKIIGMSDRNMRRLKVIDSAILSIRI